MNTPETPRMCKCGHSEDSHVDKGVGAGCMVGGCRCRLRVPDVLRKALAASQQEVERLTAEIKANCSRSEMALVLEVIALKSSLALAQKDGERWQDYAIHLAHCRECGTSNVHCVRGQTYRDACFDAGGPPSPPPETTQGET